MTNGATARTVALWVLDYMRMKGYKPPAETIENLKVDEKEIKAILGQHPHCDFCACSLHEKRRVMMIICGECWQLWNEQAIAAKAEKTAAMGASALEIKP